MNFALPMLVNSIPIRHQHKRPHYNQHLLAKRNLNRFLNDIHFALKIYK